MKKIRKEILIPILIAVFSGVVLTVWEFWFKDITEPEKKVIKNPKKIHVDLKEFYVLSGFDKEILETNDSIPYYYYWGIQESVYKGNILLNNLTGHKRLSNKNNHYRTRYQSFESLESLSGISVYSEKQQYSSVKNGIYNAEIKDGFAFYNPKMIKWVADNFIPQPNASNINGFLFQQIYNRRLKNTTRLLAKAYWHFRDENSYVFAQKEYQKAMKNNNFFGPDYLFAKYGKKGTYSTNFNYSTAVGFWLRRGIDGTNIEAWKALSKLLKLYDKEWFYSSNKVDLQLYNN